MGIKYLELMEQKTAVLERILDITRKVVLTGEKDVAEKEGEEFSNLYERREPILKRIAKIDADLKIEAMGLPPLDEPEYKDRLTAIIDKQKDVATQLLALDEANVKIYEKLKAHMQGNMKNVRQTIDVNEKYLDLEPYESAQGYYFDKKN